jgi:hypothetical protein
MAALVLLFLLAGGVVIAVQSGPVSSELAKVVRFGIRASHLGNQPTVIVRTTNGKQYEIVALAGSIKGCASGEDIRLLRRGNWLEVAPVGCP